MGLYISIANRKKGLMHKANEQDRRGCDYYRDDNILSES